MKWGAYKIHNGWPNYASWKTLWKTDAQGNLPGTIYVPPATWVLRVHADGYSTTTMAGTISGGMGANCPAGEILMMPLDGNANQMADRWEAIRFGALTNALSSDDSDGDGASNEMEYLAGTNPNDANDCFEFQNDGGTWEPSGYTLRWPAVAGHAYRVMGTESLTGLWEVVGGPWTNESAGEMTWTDTEATEGHVWFYRVEENRP